MSKVWDDQAEKILKQKIDIRRLKLRVKNRFINSRKIGTIVRPQIFECPVYLCKFSHQVEQGLIDHYDKEHADLVELGLRLIKSRETREREK